MRRKRGGYFPMSADAPPPLPTSVRHRDPCLIIRELLETCRQKWRSGEFQHLQ